MVGFIYAEFLQSIRYRACDSFRRFCQRSVKVEQYVFVFFCFIQIFNIVDSLNFKHNVVNSTLIFSYYCIEIRG